MKLEGKFYWTVVRPTMLYGSVCWRVESGTDKDTTNDRDENVETVLGGVGVGQSKE